MENFALIFVALLIGYGMNLKNIFAKDAPLILNQFILYISLPAMIFLQIPKLSFSFDALIPVVISWIVMGLSALAILAMSRVLMFSRQTTGALMLVGVLGNTSFVGIPIVQAYLGEDALAYVLMYDQLGSFIFLSTYGTFISIYYTREEKINIKAIAIKMLTFPTFIALVLSLFFIGSTFHPVVISVLSSLASTIVPLALVAVGLQLRFKLPRDEIKPFSVALIVQLIAAPLIALGTCYLFSWNTLAGAVSIMEAGMGPMITAGAVASMAGLAPRLSSAIVGYGTLLSLISTWIIFNAIS
jgi:hypothetical protein